MRLNTFWTDHKMIKHLVNMDFMTVSSKSTILTSLRTTRQIKSIGAVICLRHPSASHQFLYPSQHQTPNRMWNHWLLHDLQIFVMSFQMHRFVDLSPFNTIQHIQINGRKLLFHHQFPRFLPELLPRKAVEWLWPSLPSAQHHLHSTSCTAQWRFKSLECEELMGLSPGDGIGTNTWW